MFRLNLKIAWRNLWKHKGYTLINILGLSIGMASCILIFIFINFHLSFDKGYKNEDRIYRFTTDWNYISFQDYTQGVPIPLAAAARNEFPDLEKVGAIFKDAGVIQIKDKNGSDLFKSEEEVYYTEPQFFEIFDIPWLSGKPTEALSQPNTVALSEKMAKRYFGSVENAMGKSIFLGLNNVLKVTGVFKDRPANSSLPLNIIISYETFWLKKSKSWDSVGSLWECYALLKKGVDITDLKQPLAQFNKKHYQDKKIEGNQTNSLQTLGDIHFSERYGNFTDKSIAKKELYGLAVIGLFLLITACINFINLATAQAVNRSKEVGIKKVMGSKRKQLIAQFLTETLSITMVSLLLALVLAEIALPQLQNLLKGNIVLSLFGQPVIFLFLALLVLIVSLLAGFYPAMIMSGFTPALAIKNKVSVNTGSLGLRKILVVIQFSITIILIISTLVIIRQMKYVAEKPLGFNIQAIAMLNIPADSISRNKYNSFKERIMKIPGVEQAAFCSMAPLSGYMSTTNFSYNGKQNKDFEIRLSRADQDYFKLFNLKLLAGKVFNASDTVNGYVVNETFLKKIYVSNPQEAIGKVLNQNGLKAPIVGVVKDFNDKSLKENISPIAIFNDKRQYSKIAVKMDKTQILSVMKEVETLWTSTFSNHVYNSSFVDDDINGYYESERVMGVLFKVFAVVIIFISFIGLFGLISFVATQRTKEVAIRKVLGASTYELVKMLNGSFLLMVFIANLVAWPLAYLFVNRWLGGFAYRIEMSIWPFVFAMFISMLITLITVSLRSYKAAVTNTVDALKTE